MTENLVKWATDQSAAIVIMLILLVPTALWLRGKIDYIFEQLFGSKESAGWIVQFLKSHEKIAEASATQVEIGNRLAENMGKLTKEVSTLKTGLNNVETQVKLLTHEVQELKGQVSHESKH